MTAFRLALLTAAALPLAACATTGDRMESTERATAEAAATDTEANMEAAADAVEDSAENQSEHDKLFELFAADDETDMRLSPVSAIYRGDLRYAAHLGNSLTDENIAERREQVRVAQAGLAAIDRGKLDATDKIAYDVFQYSQQQAAKGLTDERLALTQVRPVNHFFGMHTFYPTFSSGEGGAPYKTVKDYENGLSRNRDYIALVDRQIAKSREGMASGVLETKLTIGNVIEQLDTQIATPVEKTPFWGPIEKFPADFSAADKARFTRDYRASISQVEAANRKLRDFLKTEYLPVARDSVGLSQMKGGTALYTAMIEDTTTLPLTPDYLHNLGLSEVARILKGMEEIKGEVGFKGTLAQFFDYLRTDKKFQASSREELTQQYYALGKKVEALTPQFFSHRPKTALEIRPYEPFREKFEAGGSYESGTPDGSRPGVFYFNAYDLPARATWEETTLFLHEGEPGHHFQISLAQENDKLPAFMRFGGNTAYVEGWALYAETLGYPMGLYKDPYQRFGTLNDEMLRAMRLVVDTGIHAQGWSRDKAIAYMLANSGMSRTDATAEVERYIAIPSQALAYKVGALTVQRLRKKAEGALGAKFDIRDFHDQVLNTGALPLPVLEKKIDDWIAAGGG